MTSNSNITPSSNNRLSRRIKQNQRRSSLLYQQNESPALSYLKTSFQSYSNQTIGSPSSLLMHNESESALDTSESNKTKTKLKPLVNLNKEILNRKLALNKIRKAKRAKLIEKTRHLNEDDYETEEEELEDRKIDDLHSMSKAQSEMRQQEIESQETKENLVKEEKIEVDEAVTIKLEQTAPKEEKVSKFSSSNILSKINSFKNTVKNIVSSYSTSANNNQKQAKQAVNSVKSPRAQIINTQKSLVRPPLSRSNSNMNVVSKIRDSTAKTSTLATSSSAAFSSTTNISLAQKKYLLKKQESSSSCKFPLTSSSLTKPTASSLSKTLTKQCHMSTTSLRSYTSNSKLNNIKENEICKPAFKIGKIKYDDRYLYDSGSNPMDSIDKNKYYKLITNRKVASNMGSTNSLA